jgi:hypothetical protein
MAATAVFLIGRMAMAVTTEVEIVVGAAMGVVVTDYVL